MRWSGRCAGLLLASQLAAATATAQTVATPVDTASLPPGWSATPSAAVAELWDDNIALTGDGGNKIADLVTAVTPALALNYRGRYSQLTFDYRSTFDLYRERDEFDSADHLGRLEFDRRLGRSANLFARNNFTMAPTTELPATADAGLIVLRRRTTRFNDFRGGFEFTTGRHSTLTTAYTSQWVSLAGADELQPLLRGGYSHGADVAFRREVSSRTTVGASYRLQHAVVAEGAEAFDVQHAAALLELELAPSLTMRGSAGYAWLLAGRDTEGRSAPAYQVGLAYARRRATWELSYARAYLPSFGFGGTVQNQEVRGSVRAPLSRRVHVAALLAARRNEPLSSGQASLRSVAAQGSVQMTLVSWLRLEVFAVHALQDSQRAGGRVGRTRAGVRLVTLHSTRLR
ncbi:MAG: hypothetical protein R2712_18045 [Vicinamibacterales bacterium]